MRLREVIRQPERYDSEIFYTPPAKRTTRDAKRRGSTSYIDFDPNLPPAAFPTLERSRLSGDTIDKPREDKEKTRQPAKDERSTSPSDRCSDNEREAETQVDLEDVPYHMIENYIASNGIFNPIYERNMAIMTDEPQRHSVIEQNMEVGDLDEVMADSSEEVVTEKYPSLVDDTNWDDLSPRLQVQIFENLLESHSWSRACRILELTPEQSDQIYEHFVDCDEQMNYENRQLLFMREKQLRALLRADNSSWPRRVPPKIAFHNISKRYTAKLRENIHEDYLLCHAGELKNARKFLQLRGIDQRYAGNWSNSLAILQTSEDDSEPEEFEWEEEFPELFSSKGTPVSADDYTPGSSTGTCRRFPMATEWAVIDSINKTATVNPRKLSRREYNEGVHVKHQNPHTNNSNTHNNRQLANPHSGVVRLKIGTERAAQIMEPRLSYATLGSLERNSQAVDNEAPFSNAGYLDGDSSSDLSPRLPSRSVSPSIRRVFPKSTGGNWSDGPFEDGWVPFATSDRLIKRLEKVRLGAQQEREREVNGDNSDGNAIVPAPQSRQSPIISPSTESQLTPPGRIMFPPELENPQEENDLLPFQPTQGSWLSTMETPESGWMVYDFDLLKLSSPITVSSFSLNEPSQPMTPIDDFMSVSEDWCTEDEEEGEADEMVLVPAI